MKKTETTDHYNAIMIEDLHAKMDLVIEGMETRTAELRREMSIFREEVNTRFDILEAVVKGNSQGIRELQGRMDRVETRLDNVENRLDRMDTRFDNLDDKLDRAGKSRKIAVSRKRKTNTPSKH